MSMIGSAERYEAPNLSIRDEYHLWSSFILFQSTLVVLHKLDNVPHSNVRVSARFRGLLLLLPLNDIAGCKYIRMTLDL
jgi:hypothetical protein